MQGHVPSARYTNCHNTYNNPLQYRLSLSSLFRGGNGGADRWSNLPKVTQLGSFKLRQLKSMLSPLRCAPMVTCEEKPTGSTEQKQKHFFFYTWSISETGGLIKMFLWLDFQCPGKAVAMMYQERMFNLSVIQDPRMQVLELRYQGGISMYIMLPQSENLSEVSYHSHSHCWGWLLGYWYLCVHLSVLRFQVVGMLETYPLIHLFAKYLMSTYYVPSIVMDALTQLSIILFKQL